MSGSSMTVKAYLDRGAENPEIRRFAVDQSVWSERASLTCLKAKIGQVFPSLTTRNKDYNLFWKDSDNDLVSFSSDDELTEALGFVSDDVFRVYIRIAGADLSGVLHKGVVCDACEKEIRGARYKCTFCPDYDLCSCCELQGKHTQHDMLRMCTPRPSGGPPPFMPFPFMHHGPQHHGGPHGPPHHGGPHGPPPPPPPPGGPDGCGGEGGPWGHPWRRMMKRCWRRMMREQWGAPGGDFSGGFGGDGGSGGGDPSCSRDSSVDSSKTARSGDTAGEGGCKSQEAGCGEEKSGEEREKEHEDYLRNMGDSVAAMLDPLGIDVHVDIEHKGQQSHVHGQGRRGRGGCGRGRGRGRGGRGGPWGRGPWGMFGGPWGFAGANGAWGPPPAPHAQQQGQGEPAAHAEAAAAADVEMQESADACDGNSKAQEMSVGSPTPPSDEGADWTVVGKDREVEVEEDDEQMKASPAPAQAPNPDAQVIYPQLPTPTTNPRIVDALAQMKAMGYNDEGGWLSSLLEAKGGSINQVLDVLQPKPQ